MTVVVRWSGREARALRLAKRMSVRDFAAHLGVNDAAVSSWEKRGEHAGLRYETQQLLDADLACADDDVRQRFERIIAEGPAGVTPPEQRSPALARSHSGSTQLVSGERPLETDAETADQLLASSSARTRVMLDTIRAGADQRLRYVPPRLALDRIADFFRSPQRVFVLKGLPGCGKTALTHHIAEELTGNAEFQLHSAAGWRATQFNLATEILRYSSIPGREDSLLTLEKTCYMLGRPLLVIIDAIDSRPRLEEAGRQVDTILRQVATNALRFLLVLRTPPDMEFSAFPVLAASIFGTSCPHGASYLMCQWNEAEARRAWNRPRNAAEPAFSDLPESIQRLARVPLYAQLIKAAGSAAPSTGTNAYMLVDYCIRSLVREESPGDAILGLARLVAGQATELIPVSLRPSTDSDRAKEDMLEQVNRAAPPLARASPDGQVLFEHDVIREYFAATGIADLVIQRGRSAVTAAALNDLAQLADVSAAARGVLEFAVHSLDERAPGLATALALSPTINPATTLPLMLGFAAPDARFVTQEVLRACCDRCIRDSSLPLARALLPIAAVKQALGADHATWLVGLLRAFGSAIWADMTSHMEQVLDAEVVSDLLAAADLDKAEAATFFARNFFLFFGDFRRPGEALETLLGHPDWRVRAALAEGLQDERSPRGNTSEAITTRLIHDADYKVRAAAAKAVRRAEATATKIRHLKALLSDTNWHVRKSALHEVLADPAGSASARAQAASAVDHIKSDPSWSTPPAHVAKLMHRLLLLQCAGTPRSVPPERNQALFGLLRESRTGWTRFPPQTQHRLIEEAEQSSHWLAQREAAFTREASEPHEQSTRGSDLSPHEAFRCLRGQRSMQAALDLHNLGQALDVAQALASARVDFIEVGDPLIKRAGLNAVERIKRHAPQVTVVAEMMSADWGRDQVELAAEHGADVVLLIGPATVASVSAAAEAGRRLGVPIILDVPTMSASQQWIRDMERAGIDGLAITTNIDLGVGTGHPLAKARAVRNWTRLPVAVSGGFSPADYDIINSPDWDILIIGRSITEAVQPMAAARQFLNLIRHSSKQRK